MKPVARQALNS